MATAPRGVLCLVGPATTTTTTSRRTRILHMLIRSDRSSSTSAAGRGALGLFAHPTAAASTRSRSRTTLSTTSPFFFATDTTSSLETPSNTTSRFFFSTPTTSLESSASTDNNNKDNDNEKKRIVFLGTPDVAADCLQKIHQASLLQNNDSASSSCSFEVVRVVTQPPKRRKRNGSKLEASPVAKVAERLGIPVLCPEKANDDDFLQELQHVVQPHLCITAAYGQYLPKRFLATPTLGTINIHPSLLPRWRGASPVQRSLEAGDNPVGVTLLFTVSKMDAGPIIAQKEQYVSDETDTATTVLPMLFDVGTNLLLEALPDILSGKINMNDTSATTTIQQQDESMVVNAAIIQSSEAELKVWQESATTCHNRLRGFSIWPGAFMYLKVGDDDDRIMKVKVIQTRVVPRDENDPPVELTDKVELGPTKKSGLYVVCYDGSILELLAVQPATRKAFAARDFQNGYPGETIRWVKTPADQLKDPAKYNSRVKTWYYQI
jgi:methionyl-tRNA formyltransferase